MIYCDASLIVAVLAPERHSAVATRWIEEQRDALAISPWVSTEVASALAMKRRRGLMSAPDRTAVLAGWQALVIRSFLVTPITTHHFTMAETLVDSGPRGLRASDALHLAIAVDRGFAMATLDDDLEDAARASGIAVESIRDRP